MFSPYPFIFEGKLYSSSLLSQNINCIKCKSKECCLQSDEDEFICQQQYNCISLFINGQKLVINGIIYKENKTIAPGRKDARKDWIVDRADVIRFISNISKLEEYLVNQANIMLERKNFIYHDFKTSLSIFFSCTQDIIDQLPGGTFEEKLKNSDKSYQDLYNSLELITSQLGMIDVIINPKSIEFGTKKPINMHRLFQKMKILFEHLSMKKKDISIVLISERWIDDCLCYESIEFLPLILLDNAIKYSVVGSEIEIKLEQSRNNIKVLVKNIGPFVSDKNKDKIFDKFYRDESAQIFSKQGIGMGLWIGQQILQAHGSHLLYHKDAKGTKEIGLNIFEFNLPTI